MARRQVAAALGPANVRHEAHALRVQPRALLAGGEVDVRLRPAARPLVLGTVEAGGAQPVLPGELVGVADSQPALLRAVHQEDPAEGPERLSSQRGLWLLIDEQHSASRVGELSGRHEPRQPGPHDDDISGIAGAALLQLGSLRTSA